MLHKLDNGVELTAGVSYEPLFKDEADCALSRNVMTDDKVDAVPLVEIIMGMPSLVWMQAPLQKGGSVSRMAICSIPFYAGNEGNR